MIRWSTIGADVLDLLFPRTCPACQAADGLDADGLCGHCRDELADGFRRNYCRRCGSTVGPYATGDGRCPACRGFFWPVAGVVRLGMHQGVLRDLLLELKYGGRDELDRFFGRRLAEVLTGASWFEEVEALTAVPTYWRRHLFGRAYVATALARELGRATGLPDPALLRRVRGGPSQIGLTRAQRVKNVRGAFGLARGVKLNGAVVCLVDDVTTTGATLLECARILKRAGAAKVFAAVVCKQHGLGSQ
ncbi:MAG TPA: ComF family protein [Phycisphaerae bacterium]|nr:ComF family protein [Phycisphaerae bacterium]